MKKYYSICLVALALLLVMPAMAASKKSKYSTLTKKYHDASLEQVLNDIQTKTGYQLSYYPEDLDLNQRVTMEFKDAPAKTVLKKVLEKDKYTLTSKKGVITINKVPEPPVTYERPATEPSEIVDDSLKTVRIYQDTTYSVACRMETHELPAGDSIYPEVTSKGHYIQAFLGAGYSQVGYKEPTGIKDKGGIGGLAQIQYAYYFHENWGITAGLGFELYSSKGVIDHTYEWKGEYDETAQKWSGIPDSENERYFHNVKAKDWTEKQLMGMVNVPISIQCQYPLNEKNLRLYADLGVKIGIPVIKNQALKSGDIQHIGNYDTWGMIMQEDKGNLGDERDFYTESTGDFSLDKKMKAKTVAASLIADLGVAIPLTNQIDLMVGAYFDYCLNDIKDGDQQEMGWKQPNFASDKSYREHAFMAEYPGMVDASSALRPWQVGVKVGVQWHYKEKAKPAPKEYERIQICDTTFTLAQRTDTTMKPQVARKIVRLMNKAVIWFDLDKWDPKLEPADIIDKIAAILIENPEQKILVNGHASAEGNADHNQMLSDKRAEAVANLLLEKGVNAEQITTKGFSSQIQYKEDVDSTEEESNVSQHNISLDRRVEIIPVMEDDTVVESLTSAPAENAETTKED